MPDRRSRDHRDGLPPLSTDGPIDRYIRRPDADSGDVTPTKISYDDPYTAKSPVSEWSDDGSETPGGSSEYSFNAAAARARGDFPGSFDLDSPTDHESTSSFSARTVRESEYSFDSDRSETGTLREASVVGSQYSSASQGSATSLRYQGVSYPNSWHVLTTNLRFSSG
jgi:hypothetical protein